MQWIASAIGKIYLHLSRKSKRGIFLAIDLFLCAIALYLAFGLRFETPNAFPFIIQYSHPWTLSVWFPIKLGTFLFLGMYRPVLRYTGEEFLRTTFQSVVASSILIGLFAMLFQITPFSRSIWFIDALLTGILIISSRFVIRWLAYDVQAKLEFHGPQENIIVCGAKLEGAQFAKALQRGGRYRVVAFVDDDPELNKQSVHGVLVYSLKDLKKLVNDYQVENVLLAIPSENRKRKTEIVHFILSTGASVKTLPGVEDIFHHGFTPGPLQDIDITDLLGRAEVLPDPQLLRANITDKVVMVTGAGGSIGSELCRQIAQQSPQCLILFEWNEYALYRINQELLEAFPNLKIVAYLGSITNVSQLRDVFNQFSVDTIYHAAAYKHVTLIENNVRAGIINNIAGTLNVVVTSVEYRIPTFVLISTDKAVRPTSLMGTTKRVDELILQALAINPETPTRFVIVRFGNVLDSAGSVVPRFRKQIEKREPLTVTHPDVTRYFMSIPEASRLVIQAGAMGDGGEVFLLDMGEPIKIYDLAVQMIRLSGLKLGKDIEVKITGLAPGEKLHEELLVETENTSETRHPKIFSTTENSIPWETLQPQLQNLLDTTHHNNVPQIIKMLQQIIPTYQPSSTIQSWSNRVVASPEVLTEETAWNQKEQVPSR